MSGADFYDYIFASNHLTVAFGDPFVGTTPYPGTNANDLVFGRNGNDNLAGAAGSDLILGGPGNDNLYASIGPNSVGVNPDTPNDFNVLDGGPGNDVMYGGPGQDIFYFDSGSGTADSIRNFDPAHDWLVIREGINGLTDATQGGVPAFLNAHVHTSFPNINSAVVDLGNGNSVTIANVPPSSLTMFNVYISPV